MAHHLQANPFMLLLHPEAVLAAVAASENLERLNRRTCHPLDRHMPTPGNAASVSVADSDEDSDGDESVAGPQTLS